MKIYMDWEFFEDGIIIDPISVGLVREDGSDELYLVNKDLHWDALAEEPFLREHVAPHLPIVEVDGGFFWDPDHEDIGQVISLAQMAFEVYDFIKSTPEPELWADHAAYDHVCLAQLYGRMVNMPREIPWYTNDLRTTWNRVGKPVLPKQVESEKHHALRDAHHDAVIDAYMEDWELMSKIKLPA